MKKVFLFYIFTQVIFYAVGQSPEVIKAKQILDKAAEKNKSFQTIKADFNFTLENIQAKISDTHSGKIIIKGDKYKIDLMGADTYYNGKTVWVYLKDVREVNISNPDFMDEQVLIPSTIFSTHHEGYKYIHAGETTFNGKKVDIIDLFPDKRNKPFSRIKLHIYQDNSQIGKITQIGKDGNNYIIDIKKMETNTPVDDTIFVFDATKYPGVEVIDLR